MAHGKQHYIKIWGVLLVLLTLSVLGPMLEIKIVTLITAFGIAFVKAYLVGKHFMHLDMEKPWLRWLMVTSLVFMVMFFAAVSPDVLKHDGHRWTNDAAKAATARGIHDAPHGAAHPTEGAGEHH